MSSVAQPSAPSDAERRRAAAVRLTQQGRFEESLSLWRDELCSGEAGLNWVRAAAVEAMSWRDLTVAGELAQLYAAARWGSSWYPGPPADPAFGLDVPAKPPRTQLSVPKLRHDIEQFRLLRDRGVLGAEFSQTIDAYGALAERLSSGGLEARFPLEGDDEVSIGRVYNRIVNLAPAPRMDRALST